MLPAARNMSGGSCHDVPANSFVTRGVRRDVKRITAIFPVLLGIGALAMASWGLIIVLYSGLDAVLSNNRLGWFRHVPLYYISISKSLTLFILGALILLRRRRAFFVSLLHLALVVLTSLWVLDSFGYLRVVPDSMVELFIAYWIGSILIAAMLAYYVRRLAQSGRLT